MNSRALLQTIAGALLLAVATCDAPAQMLDPAIDRADEPFTYFSHPTDVIGVMDGKEGTLVTPEGYLYTGYGEYMFFTGNPPVPVNQRVKTLEKGYLPVVNYSFTKDSLTYRMRMFAATLGGDPEEPLMNFVRVSVANQTKTRRAACLGIATRYQNDVNTSGGSVGDNRFSRPAKAKLLGQYEQAGEVFSADWEYAFADGMFLRDGKVMYMYPESVPHVRMMTFKTGYNSPPNHEPGKKDILRTTPIGIVLYSLTLDPAEQKSLEFRIPYEPLPEKSPLVGHLREAKFDEYLGRVERFWEGIVAQGIGISLPEEKVVNTFRASLVYNLIARNKQDGFYIQKVNEFQYDAFWLRDASFIIRAYDLAGYHSIAGQCLEFFPRWQQADGNFVSQGGQYDGWGQALWAFGEHYRITRDQKFAATVYPMIAKAVGWLRIARGSDPLHLVPSTTPGDNEDITGHVTGHNFWALIGLKNAAEIAAGLGRSDDAAAFQSEYDDLHRALMNQVKIITRTTGGYIPPGLDTLGGQDWDNMSALYPEVLLDPEDTVVTATLRTTREKYQEGLMTYGNGRWLHHYLTMTNTESELVRGEQELALGDLYAILLHTSATHAGFEFCIRPWGDRDFGMNLAPHGWFAAQFRALLRNMLVREQNRQLHLLSCLSPAWINDGDTVAVRRAPTDFGSLSFDLACKKGGATLSVEGDFVKEPDEIIVHIPWFMDVRSAEAGGMKVPIQGGAIKLPRGARRVALQWSKRSTAPVLGYGRAVEDFKKEYRRRYEQFTRDGRLPD